MRRIVFDLETDGLLDALTQVHCMAAIDPDSGEEFTFVNGRYRVDGAGTLEDGLRLLESADVIAGHNIIGFDLPCLLKLYGWTHGGKSLDTRLAAQLCWSDTRRDDFEARRKAERLHQDLMPAKLIGAHSLKAWGYRLGVHKGDYGDQRTDWSTFDSEMLRYCLQDTRVTVALLAAIDATNTDPRAMALEHAFALVMRHQEETGFLLDRARADALCAQLMIERAKIADELSTLFPPRTVVYYTPKRQERRERIIPFNPASRDHIAINLTEKYGWKPAADEYTPGGKPEINDDILTRLPYPEAARLASYFTIEKRLGTLAEGKKAWLKLLKPDGRIHGGVIITGTPQGRCSHVSPNMAQVPRVGSPYGAECRELFTVPAGRVLVGCDASGMQLRGLAHYLARYDLGAYAEIVSTGDPHEANRVAAGLPTRDSAKTFIYAFLFGAGPEKLGGQLGGGKKAGLAAMGKLFRAMPALKALSRDVQAAAKARGFLKGLDGRRIPIRTAHVALNYLLSGAEAVIMKQATVMLGAKAAAAGLVRGVDYWHVAHVHDEFQLEALEAHGALLGQLGVESIREAGLHFNFRCPLDGAFKVGRNWRETH